MWAFNTPRKGSGGTSFSQEVLPGGWNSVTWNYWSDMIGWCITWSKLPAWHPPQSRVTNGTGQYMWRIYKLLSVVQVLWGGGRLSRSYTDVLGSLPVLRLVPWTLGLTFELWPLTFELLHGLWTWERYTTCLYELSPGMTSCPAIIKRNLAHCLSIYVCLDLVFDN